MSNQPRVYSFEGVTPVIDPTSYVHPSAVLIGDVIIGARCYIGGNAVLRGDFGRIELHDEANVQDNCTVHSLPDFDCVMQERSHIGHGAIIHAANIGRNVLVGMNAVVLDKAFVGENSMVAAMSFVKMGGQVPAGVLWTGIPGKVARELTEADLAGKKQGTDMYVELAARCASGLVATEALAEVETGRGRTQWKDYV